MTTTTAAVPAKKINERDLKILFAKKKAKTNNQKNKILRELYKNGVRVGILAWELQSDNYSSVHLDWDTMNDEWDAGEWDRCMECELVNPIFTPSDDPEDIERVHDCYDYDGINYITEVGDC